MPNNTPAVAEEKAQFTPWQAFCASKVYLPYKAEMMELRDRGYGDLKDEKLTLTPYESFYLFEKQKIVVKKKGTDEPLNLVIWSESFQSANQRSGSNILYYPRFDRLWIHCTRIESTIRF